MDSAVAKSFLEAIAPHSQILLAVLVVLVLARWAPLASRGRASAPPTVPFCDFENFFWAARRQLGRRFETLRDGNRVSGEGVKRYAWAVPNKEALACIARHLRDLPRDRRHVVDFGAGAGYWSLQVKKYSHFMALDDVRVTALDKNPELYDGTTWYPIEPGDLKTLESLEDAGLLLLVWPPCWEDMAMQALRAFRGDVVAYIGEGRGGATGWNTFFDELAASWVEVERVSIPNWHGRSDGLFIYQRASVVAAPTSAHDGGRHTCPPNHFQAAEARGAVGRTPAGGLLPFFRGLSTDCRGRLLADIRKFDFEHLEMVPDYVQWLFPTDEESAFVLGAPVLTEEDQAAFLADPSLRDELRLNLDCFCRFLGLELRGGGSGGEGVEVVLAGNFQERVPHCWSSMFGTNHNWFRISRVLRCLGLCGLPDERRALLACLETIAAKGLAQCDSALPHWRRRVAETSLGSSGRSSSGGRWWRRLLGAGAGGASLGPRSPK